MPYSISLQEPHLAQFKGLDPGDQIVFRITGRVETRDESSVSVYVDDLSTEEVDSFSEASRRALNEVRVEPYPG